MTEAPKRIPSLKDLVNEQVWQKSQDNFSLVSGTTIRTLNPDGSLFCKTSGHSRLCKDVFNASEGSCDGCGTCLPEILGGKAAFDNSSFFYTSLEGLLTMFLVPIYLHGQDIVGYVLLGPCVLVARKPQEEYIRVAKAQGYDPELLWNALLEIRVISYAKAHGIVELVRNICEYIVNLSGRTVVPRISTLNNALPQMNTFFESFLDLAIELSGADTGSLMFLDQSTDELVVKYNRGLSRETVARSRVKVGTGISGTAFAEKQAYILNEETQPHNRLKQYMVRPAIHSSLIVPCTLKGAGMGVLNLSAFQGSKVSFNAASLKSISRLIDMAAFSF